MKKLLYFVFLISISHIGMAQVRWMSFNEALEAQKQHPKKILIDVYATWCGPCQKLEKDTFKNEYIAQYINQNFYPVKFNAEGNESVTYKGKTYRNPGYSPHRKGRNTTHEFTMAADVRGYPTMIFLDENANIIFPISGYMSPSDIEPYLNFVASDAFKTVKTQKDFENYLKNFKGHFKN